MREQAYQVRRHIDGSIDYDFYRAQAWALRTAARNELMRRAWHWLSRTALTNRDRRPRRGIAACSVESSA
jgi:hypothetical protein